MQVSHSKAKFPNCRALKDSESNCLCRTVYFQLSSSPWKRPQVAGRCRQLEAQPIPGTEESMNGRHSVLHGIPFSHIADCEFCLLPPAGQADKITPHTLQCIRRRVNFVYCVSENCGVTAKFSGPSASLCNRASGWKHRTIEWRKLPPRVDRAAFALLALLPERWQVEARLPSCLCLNGYLL